MVRRAFFSFHYGRDVWRANQVRNCWVTKDRETAGFIDAAEFEKVKKKGDDAVKQWIDEQLKGTSVTVVLIGAETSQRSFVEYEIKQSVAKNNGLIGITIHNLKNLNGETDQCGPNPFKGLKFSDTGKLLSDVYPTYDWFTNDGYNNIGNWIETAAKKVGR